VVGGLGLMGVVVVFVVVFVVAFVLNKFKVPKRF